MKILSSQEVKIVCGGKGGYRCSYFVKDVFGAARSGGKLLCASLGTKKVLAGYFNRGRGDALPAVQQAAPITWGRASLQIAGAVACYFLVDFTVDTFEIGMFNCTDA